MHLFRLLLVGMLTLVSLVLPIATSAQDATPVALPDAFNSLPQLEISYANGEFSNIASVTAGRTLVIADLESVPDDPPALVLVKLDSTVQAWLDSGETTEADLPEWGFTATMIGIAVDGPQSLSVVDLTPGMWMFAVYPGVPDYSDPFEVTGEMPAEIPEITSDLSLMSMDFALDGLPSVIDSGPHVIDLTNMGAEPHDLVIMSVSKKLTAEQWVSAFSSMASGEDATPLPETGVTMDDLMMMSIQAAVPALSTGQTIWTQIDLEPGEYIAVCFLSSPDGSMHFIKGMLTPFTVE